MYIIINFITSYLINDSILTNDICFFVILLIINLIILTLVHLFVLIFINCDFILVCLVAYQKKQYVFKPVAELLQGKSAGLNEKHVRIIHVMANSVLLAFFLLICPVMVMSISLIVLAAMYYAYRTFDINYDPVIHSLWAIYYCFVVSQMVYFILISFRIVIGFSLYVKFKFEEVNQLLKSNTVKVLFY